MKAILMVLVIASSGSLFAGQSQYCAGFEEGFRAVKGNIVMVPMCPMAPMTPFGSTDYREGLKAGMAAANSR